MNLCFEIGLFYYFTQAEAVRKRTCAFARGYGEIGLFYYFTQAEAVRSQCLRPCSLLVFPSMSWNIRKNWGQAGWYNENVR